MPSARSDLRLATREVHERLHEAAPFRMIAQGALDMPGYRRLLSSILRFHASVGPVLAAHPETAALGGGPERVERLQSDLGHIGASGPPLLRADFALGGYEALGCLYVVQGSTLGGRVIYRQLDYLFDGAPGRSFFLGGSDDALKWQKVRSLLEEQPPQRLQAMRRGAARTFAFFEESLSGQEAARPVRG